MKDNIKAFESTAQKYGIDFAPKKGATEPSLRYPVFFKGRDALTAAFNSAVRFADICYSS